ncbi:MAG: HEAT repeat domain-containing protein [Planctomycetes bacterium]|nr:HEAT repeat domain-containing protein [Planctomycetota bacterium]
MRRTEFYVTTVLLVCVLASATGCSNPAERVETVRQLTLQAEADSAPALVEALGDSDPMVRRIAIYGLERIGRPEDDKVIIPLLGDKDPWVRRTAAVALGKLRSRDAVPHLINVLDDSDLYMRFDALVALGRIGYVESQKPLLSPSQRKQLVSALQDKRLWTELPVWDQAAVLRTFERPFFSGDPEAVAILKWLLTRGEWGPEGTDDHERTRRTDHAKLMAHNAATTLAVSFGDASGEDVLVEGLNGSDDYMKQNSARALGAIKSRKGVPGLIKMLDRHWAVVKLYAIDALGDIGDPAAVPALEQCLEFPDPRIRAGARVALTKIDGRQREQGPALAAAAIPDIADAETQCPGGKRPPVFICLGVDDCASIEGLEAMLDICETLRKHGSKVVFTMWTAPLAGDYENRDLVKQTLITQRLFDLGCEIAHHTLHHNPDGRIWHSLPKEQQVEEIGGCTQWFRDNIEGFTRPFSFKTGGGGRGKAVDWEYSKGLIAEQHFAYGGRAGTHPKEFAWPTFCDDGTISIPTGKIDASAPPVHEAIGWTILQDIPGTFDNDVPSGIAAMVANLDYRYRHPLRPLFAVNAFHDWGFKSLDDSTSRYSHRNHAAILKGFLMDVLVTEKDKYPEVHCVTFRQVMEYVKSDGDLAHTLAVGNCQDSRNPVRPLVE